MPEPSEQLLAQVAGRWLNNAALDASSAPARRWGWALALGSLDGIDEPSASAFMALGIVLDAAQTSYQDGYAEALQELGTQGAGALLAKVEPEVRQDWQARLDAVMAEPDLATQCPEGLTLQDWLDAQFRLPAGLLRRRVLSPEFVQTLALARQHID